MGYKQSPGRKNMPKTGRGIDSATLMTGSPAKQANLEKRNADGTAPLTENSSYMNQLRGSVPAATGKLYIKPDGSRSYPDNNTNSRGDIFDGDNDGDSVFNDSNDDGSMASRGLFALVNAITGK